MKNSQKAPKEKIAKQLLIVFCASLAVVMGSGLSIIYVAIRFNLENQVQQRARTVTKGIEFATEGLIEDKEVFLLERIVQNYATLPSVLEVSIVDPNGIVLAHSRMMDIRETNTNYASLHPHLEPFISQAAQNGVEVSTRAKLLGKPIIMRVLPFSSTLFKKLGKDLPKKQQSRGVVVAIMNIQEMERDALQNVLLSVVPISIGTGLILLLVSWIIHRLVIHPLTNIQLAIAESEQKGEFHLPPLPANEIGFLGSTFEAVFEQLKGYKQMELSIAERKYAEVVQRYELATHAAKVWVWDWDIQTDKFIIEQGIQVWLGYETCQLPKHFENWIDLIYVDDRQLFQEALQDHIGGNSQEFSCEHRLIDGEGKPHWFLSRGQSLPNKEGKGLRAIGTITDIEERKQAELLIRRQNERELVLREITQKIRQTLDLQTVFDTAVEEIRQVLKADRVGIFKFHLETNFDDGEFVAESVLPQFGSAIAIKVHDHCFGEQYAPSYCQGNVQVVNDIYNAGLSDCHIQILSQFQVRANLVVPLLKSDQLWGLLCIHQCDRPRVWQESEIELVKQIANQLAIAIQQAKLFEQLQQELRERHQAEVKLTESNQKLEISNDELLRATRMKDEFLANMSHELRTPLNSILGMNEALQDQIFGDINDRQLNALKTIENSSTHLLSLINDILDVSKIESGQVILDLTPTSIENLCLSSLAFIKQQALAKGIKLINNTPKFFPDLLLDERRIRQVLINLLNNAVKFTLDNGTITLDVSRVPVDLESQNSVFSHYLRISVIDTGIGISTENIQKLFQPFIQIDSALNRQYEGTGLGLALVKRIVELHGGRVSLTSEVGLGSCFTVDLPFNTPNTEFKANDLDLATTAPEPSRAEGQDSPLILLAEDNEASISTFYAYLEALGYRLVIAKDGKSLVEQAKVHRPDIIVTDIQMPNMDGLTAIKLLRAESILEHTPIIALTALAMTGDRERCLAAGADDYLAKPIKLKLLANTIQKLLDRNI